jgi:hypothetical protein
VIRIICNESTKMLLYLGEIYTVCNQQFTRKKSLLYIIVY